MSLSVLASIRNQSFKRAVFNSPAAAFVSKRYFANNFDNQLKENSPEKTDSIQSDDSIQSKQSDNSKIITSNVVQDTNLHSALKTAFVKNVGETLTPVQEQCINEFISSKNGIVVRAKTGTGKTFAFGIPVIHSVLTLKDENVKQADRYVNSVIFSPTRDLAFQTRKSLSELWNASLAKSEHAPKKRHSYPKKSRLPSSEKDLIPLVIGQTPYRATMSHFVSKEVPPIVVATPGRFMDMLENEPKFRTSFKHLQNIIIDEADELLNGNFKEDINKIIDELNSIREPIPGIEDNNSDIRPKTMLFSATVNDDVFDLAERAIGKDFPFVDVTGNKTEEVNENISQTVVQTQTIFDTYTAAIQFILDHVNNKNFKPIIFLSTTSSVDFITKLLSDVLRSEGSRRRVLPFHGKLTQGRRDASQRIFREKDNAILVASGIGARGMDFPNVSHVIQIGVSSEIDSHTHKIGRTGRAGKQGDALLFTCKMENPFVTALKKNGNKFGEVIIYDNTTPESVEVAEKIVDQTKSYLDLEDTFFKSLTHYRNIPSRVAKLDLDSLAIDVAKTYSRLIEGKKIKDDENSDEDADEDDENSEKLTMSYNMAKNMGLDFRKVEPYFNLTGRRPETRSNNNSRGNYSNNNRSSKRVDWNGDRNGDRNNNYSRNRNDRRSSFNRNDRNDRNRGSRNDSERFSRW
ncbi:hypothetical protein C6P40_000561 [Pichia californica]|uniref:ATP-dependent RNA helicase n=1 Tax=Pichia californica TaxID=460514 RepID=A0A9P6WMI7_9ASCO|nr:hypothetical protein C6P42_000509 [[Candida] californica]KAG0688753.1 hypothetical protein C6P40_000561 [[Candida] californica]